MTRIQGRCPSCHGESLFLGSEGYVTCSRLECDRPDAASDLLIDGPEKFMTAAESPAPAATEPMSAQKFRKKPVVIDAMQLTAHNKQEVVGWMRDRGCEAGIGINAGGLSMNTLEGEMQARIGAWVIRGVAGEFYPCNPDIFAATYEPAQSGEAAKS